MLHSSLAIIDPDDRMTLVGLEFAVGSNAGLGTRCDS